MANDRRDENLHPDRKYKGILYNPRDRQVSDDDLDVAPRRARRPASAAPSYSMPRKPAAPSARVQRASARAAHASGKKSGGRLSSASSISSTASRKRAAQLGGFWDGNVKKLALICAVIAAVSAIAIPTAFAKPQISIVLNDGGREVPVETSAATVGEFLEDNHVALAPEDLLELDPQTPVTDGMEVIIWRAKPVTVHSGIDHTETVSMVAGTVGDALALAGVEPAPQDEVYPSLDSPVRADMKIEHIVVTSGQTSETHEIPFDKVEKETSGLAKGKTDVVQDGENGELEITKEQLYKNGILISETVVSEEVIKEPVDQVTHVGTYVAPKPKKTATKTSTIHSDTSGGATTMPDGTAAKYTLQMEVTAYCSACNSGSRTATGTYPQRGTVAAKTSVLPFGTKLFIPGYGYGIVEDTGGFGTNVIDVFLGERGSCSCGGEWGRKNLTVYVIE